jgi:hypothetical protein
MILSVELGQETENLTLRGRDAELSEEEKIKSTNESALH